MHIILSNEEANALWVHCDSLQTGPRHIMREICNTIENGEGYVELPFDALAGSALEESIQEAIDRIQKCDFFPFGVAFDLNDEEISAILGRDPGTRKRPRQCPVCGCSTLTKTSSDIASDMIRVHVPGRKTCLDVVDAYQCAEGHVFYIGAGT